MAKRFGRQLTRAQLRPDWDSENHKVMREVIRAKFAENDDLASALLQTGTAILIEGNNWGDTYWGMMETSPCVWIGENHLGKILMAERDRLRSKDLTPRRLT